MLTKLSKELKTLREISPRTEWVKANRVFLLKQISQSTNQPKIKIGFFGYIQFVSQFFRFQLLQPAVVMLLVMATFLGSSLTINAAFYSLPGESLYRVKLALEKTHVALITDEQKKAEMKIEFAQKRAEELNKIVAQTDVAPEVKKRNIEAVVAEFKSNVVAVNNHLNKLSQSIKVTTDENLTVDPKDQQRTVRMAIEIGNKADELVKTFDKKIEELPAEEKTEVEKIVADAVETVQKTSVSAQELVADVNKQVENNQSGEVKGIEAGPDDLINGDKPSTNETSTPVLVK